MSKYMKNSRKIKKFYQNYENFAKIGKFFSNNNKMKGNYLKIVKNSLKF